MSQVIWLCSRPIYIDDRARKICFGDENNCIKYRTVKQFDVAFETLAEMIKYCKNCMYEVKDEAKKDCKVGT
jgi:hypothetical protein